MTEAVERERQFAAVVEHWLPGIYAYFRRLGVASATAEDLAQETFLLAWQRLPRLRDEAKMQSWVYGIAYRRYLTYRRRRPLDGAPSQPGEDPARRPVGGSAADGDPGSDRELGLRATRQAVLSLPEAYRQPLVLLYWEGLSYEEAARALSLPLGTLAWRVRRALQLLRQALTEEEVSHD